MTRLTYRTAAAVIAVVAVTAAPAHADTVKTRGMGGRTGSGTSAHGALAWTFEPGGLVTISTRSTSPVRYRCTAAQDPETAFDSVEMTGTVKRGASDEWTVRRRPARVQFMHCAVS